MKQEVQIKLVTYSHLNFSIYSSWFHCNYLFLLINTSKLYSIRYSIFLRPIKIMIFRYLKIWHIGYIDTKHKHISPTFIIFSYY